MSVTARVELSALADAYPPSPAPRDRLLPLKEVITMTGIGKTMIYRLMQQERFPQQYKPGGYASRWSEAEVRHWVAEQRGRAA